MSKISKKIKAEAEEENETPESEQAEHDKGAEEKEQGLPPHDNRGEDEGEADMSSGADIPEEFQADCQKLLADCSSIPCLDYISSKLSEKRAVQVSRGRIHPR